MIWTTGHEEWGPILLLLAAAFGMLSIAILIWPWRNSHSGILGRTHFRFPLHIPSKSHIKGQAAFTINSATDEARLHTRLVTLTNQHQRLEGLVNEYRAKFEWFWKAAQNPTPRFVRLGDDALEPSLEKIEKLSAECGIAINLRATPTFANNQLMRVPNFDIEQVREDWRPIVRRFYDMDQTATTGIATILNQLTAQIAHLKNEISQIGKA
jgi:hypothetical protein